ncbi:hypothetical protein [Campylobacter geochelonis]|uniref:Uncharacterized protein n=1 Tax=Campylobacter geochelonis TaxID=1780362 RepID=A0A128ELQ4_9BACT|nr:hypothetical protein [Campylobacter geochelonis]QKF71968.1 hypothetical protein CGEO_1694 [Campylobacter geochelonis]CZE47783.1 Uncharacterised protein [Campylobacter geochelonis]CZE49952.1 Uncharacterised protein [Campylobacter geochelonis]
MLNDIKQSIKAKLYDFRYSPFMSSFVISWMLLNINLYSYFSPMQNLMKSLNY